MDTVTSGSRRLLAAIREGDAAMALLGAALLAFGLLRRLDGPRQELVYSARIKRGHRVEVAVVPGDAQRTR